MNQFQMFYDEFQRILDDFEPLPAQLVRPVNGKLVWILDNDAASLISPEKLQ